MNLTSSSTLGSYYPFECVDLSDINNCFESDDEPNSWLCFDFKEKRVKINAYSIRAYDGGFYLQSWRIDGSNDNKKWILLDNTVKEKSIIGSGL